MGVSFLQTSPPPHSDTSPSPPHTSHRPPTCRSGLQCGGHGRAHCPPRPAQGLIWGQHHLFLAFHINATDSSPRQEIPDIKLIPAMLTASPGPALTTLDPLPRPQTSLTHPRPHCTPIRAILRRGWVAPGSAAGDARGHARSGEIQRTAWPPPQSPCHPPCARQGPPPPNRGDPKVLGEPQLLGAPLHPTPEEVLLHPAG